MGSELVKPPLGGVSIGLGVFGFLLGAFFFVSPATREELVDAVRIEMRRGIYFL